MKKWYRLIGCTILLLGACHSSPVKEESSHIIEVKPIHFTKMLYFSGVVDPLSKTPVLSPVEGTVDQIFYQYGYSVKEGEVLGIIQSSNQSNVYENALADYVKTKQALDESENKVKVNQQLFKEGIISKDEYVQSKTTFQLNRLSFIQSQAKLMAFLKVYHITQLPQVSLSNLNNIQKALEQGSRVNQIPITAPISGIALFSKEDKGKVGARVQAGELLLYIGDLSGITVPIQINDINLHQLKLKTKVEVSTLGLSPIVLHGFIKSIELQAKNEEGLPQFSALIEVPHLLKEEQEILHVGMNVKISVQVDYNQQIVIPLKAIIQKGEKSFVQTVDSTTEEQTQLVQVTTGETTEDSVLIISGLKTGDHILVYD